MPVKGDRAKRLRVRQRDLVFDSLVSWDIFGRHLTYPPSRQGG